MKNYKIYIKALLSMTLFFILFSSTSCSSEDKVSGSIENGYRILSLDAEKGNQKFTVYRGDYIKFKLPKGFDESMAVFSTLKEEKELVQNLDTTAYFKMKQIGEHPFQIKPTAKQQATNNFLQGEIKVIEYLGGSYNKLTAKEADSYIKANNPFILDVRTEREYAQGHLENSVLIPVQQLQARISELDPHKNNPILIYCATGNRSTVASKILIDAGFSQIFNLKRGIVDWAGKKYPIVR